MLRLVPAETLDNDALTGLFNQAYSDYVLPLRLEPSAFRWMVDVTAVDLPASRAVLDDDEPVAFALVALRPPHSWIAGMGAIPGRRRQGYGEQVLTAVLAEARGRGAETVLLEVVDDNVAALRLYEKLGFERVRDLVVWTLDAPAGTGGGVCSVDPAEAAAWIEANRPSPEPWQRSHATIERMQAHGLELEALAVEREGGLVGAILYQGSAERARLVQVAATDTAAARDLLSATAGRTGGLRAINMPADEPPSQALEELGGRVEARQHEMLLRL